MAFFTFQVIGLILKERNLRGRFCVLSTCQKPIPYDRKSPCALTFWKYLVVGNSIFHLFFLCLAFRSFGCYANFYLLFVLGWVAAQGECQVHLLNFILLIASSIFTALTSGIAPNVLLSPSLMFSLL